MGKQTSPLVVSNGLLGVDQATPTSGRLRRSWERNADVITDTLDKLVQSGGLRIPRGGYIVTRANG